MVLYDGVKIFTIYRGTRFLGTMWLDGFAGYFESLRAMALFRSVSGTRSAGQQPDGTAATVSKEDHISSIKWGGGLTGQKSVPDTD